MTNEELKAIEDVKAMISRFEEMKTSLEQQKSPGLLMLFGQIRLNEETIQFFLEQGRKLQSLAAQWVAEYPGSEIALRCARDVEAITVAPQDRRF